MHARVTRERGRVNEIAVLVFVFSVPTLIPGMVHASKGHANVASILIPISLMGYASVAQSTHTAAATTTPMATTTSSLGLTEVPLYHLSLDGELSSGVWIEIAIGTPPQQAAILLDTGSSTLALAPPSVTSLYGPSSCEVCPSSFGNLPCQYPMCGPTVTDAFLRNEGVDSQANQCVLGAFDPTNSSTFAYLPTTPTPGNDFTNGAYACMTANAEMTRCEACVQYGDQSGEDCGQGFAGDLATDVLSVGGLNATVSFATVTLIQEGFQVAPAAGIMGVAFEQINTLPANPHEFGIGGPTTMQPVSIDLLLTANGKPNAFSMCMGTPNTPGIFVLGGENPAYRTNAMAQVPIESSGGYYGISVGFVSIGPAESINSWSSTVAETVFKSSTQQPIFAASNPVVDSGTPYLQLPSGLNNVFNSWPESAYTCTTSNDCVMGIHLSNGVNLSVPGMVDCVNRQCTPNGWISLQQTGSETILGYAVMRHYYILFNRDPSNRYFGFANASAACHDHSAYVIPPSEMSSGSRSSSKQKLSVGDDIGIAIGAAVILVIVLSVALFVCHDKMARNRTAEPDEFANALFDRDPYGHQSMSDDGYAQASHVASRA